MKKNNVRQDAATGTTTAKQMTKKSVLKKVDPTMVEMLVDFENCKIREFANVIEFINNSTIPNKEEVIEEWKQAFQNEENHFVLGGRFNQYVLTYDDFNNIITFEDTINDEFSFGYNLQDSDFDYHTFVDIACALNDDIEEYFGDEIIEDCGVFWEINE